jgi:pyridoxamine 5'-phosphate oxidase
MTGRDHPFRLEDLPGLIWSELVLGVANRRHPFHAPVVRVGASIHTVVLRRAEAAPPRVGFHTDQRSHKVQTLRHDSALDLLVYHPGQKVQVRLRGQAQIHTDDALADQAWAATRMFSRRCYLALNTPGTDVPEGTPAIPEPWVSRAPTPDESEAGRKNFCVVTMVPTAMDWLLLTAHGNLRASFDWRDGGWAGAWRAP